jgi:hypothetical protein
MPPARPPPCDSTRCASGPSARRIAVRHLPRFLTHPRTLLLGLLLAAACLPTVATATVDLNADNESFGLLGIVAGQTARISVVNTSAANSLPCQVELRFVGASGATLLNADGFPQQSQVTLAPGASTSFDLRAPASAVDAANRVAVRPVLRRIPPLNPRTPRCALLASAELFDSVSGITTVAIPTDPVLPVLSALLAPRFGLLGLVAGQTARFSVVNLSPLRTERLELGFVGANGQTVVNIDGQPLLSQVTLAPGASAMLDARAPATAQDGASRVALRPVLRRLSPQDPVLPLGALLTSAEVFDSVSGVTTVATPGDPVLPIGVLR